MAGVAKVSIGLKVTGLGEMWEWAEKFTTTTPTRKIYHYMVQATADSEEALPVGDVGTVELIVIKAVENAVDIDTTFDTTFNAEISLAEGDIQVFKPAGTLYMKNNGAGEQVTVEYLVIGTA
ncbi:MAG: hypothetical protein ACTSWQ_02790 [Candidatus Thorarchaeota archaeon]